MTKSVIVAAARTPIGSFQGSLASLSAPELGAIAIREAITRAGIKPGSIDRVLMGCVLTAGLGQSPARQAALAAWVPNEVNALTVNKVCSSGLVAVMLADQMIRAGDVEICVAGGMESMSNTPYLLRKVRTGLRLGDSEIVDSLIYDGLRNAHGGEHMGTLADLCAQKFKFSRKEQDAFAVESYQRAQHAISSHAFRDEIVPVKIPVKKGEQLCVDTDEEPSRVKFDKVASLPPVFSKEGTVTVANASSLADGAAALVIMSEARAKKMKLKPLASIVAQAQAAHEPSWYTTAPIKAAHAVLKKVKYSVADIDLFEINEAFAVVTLAAIRELGLDPKKVNVHGGAVALGHPIGASGARLLTTLLYALKRHRAHRGLVAVCNGGGEATAMIVERNAT